MLEKRIIAILLSQDKRLENNTMWYAIAKNLMTYNAEGKRIRSENLAWQITTTAWDCCHKVSETQPDGSTTTWDYDAEGRVIAQRGATYPVDYSYDEFGEKIAMTTYRNAGGPGFVPAAGDTTTWLRDEATGLVTNKVYADGKGPTYTYTPDGKLW